MNIEQNIITPEEDSLGIGVLDRKCKDLNYNPTRSRGQRFWKLLNAIFGNCKIEDYRKPITNRVIPDWHPLYEFCENKDRKGALAYLHELGFRFDDKGVHLEPVNSTKAFKKLDTEIYNPFTEQRRKIESDTEFLHKGSIDGWSKNGRSYDNRRQLRERGIWGNPDAWNYVGTEFVSCGSGHMGKQAMLFVDKDKLFDMRKMFFDTEGIIKDTEFGHAFKFKGGIPLEAITRIELPKQIGIHTLYEEITAEYTPEEFIELAA